jgi:CRISPR-associated protein Csb2
MSSRQTRRAARSPKRVDSAMATTLAIVVRFHDGRYHGDPDWPPSPARVFQALVAGSARQGEISDVDRSALRWIEVLEPPVIAVPIAREGRRLTVFVPNNDLDSVGGDPEKLGSLRRYKFAKPRLFDAATPLHYVWHLDGSRKAEELAAQVCRLADDLYQLGRGVDMAWACGEVLDDVEAARRLASYPGAVFRPRDSGQGLTLACPQAGSLDSLIARHTAQRGRFIAGDGMGKQVFVQPPKPRFVQVAYDSPTTCEVYDLNDSKWPLARCVELVELARDKAAERLKRALVGSAAVVDRVFVGRGAVEADKSSRIQLVALPSIGHQHADRMIRRLLVRVPPNCPISRDDVAWAFSGLVLQTDPDTGEILLDLVATQDNGMPRHYGVGATSPARCWRSVTPVALPWAGVPRRHARGRDGDGIEGGQERADAQAQAAVAVRQALRHSGMCIDADIRCVQREPFEAKGARSEAFASGPRFAAQRLWHVEVEFSQPVAGPVVIGDGRYLGLGLMRPLTGGEHQSGLFCFDIEAGLTAAAAEADCVRALRRATMSRVQETLGSREPMPRFFSGHEPDGSPASDPGHSHLAFVADFARNRLLVVAPHVLQGRPASRHDLENLRILEQALQDMSELRAGASGVLRLAATGLDRGSDPLFRSARTWESVSEYRPTRHGKRVTAVEALIADAKAEVARRGLPEPEWVEVSEVRAGPRGGLAGRLELRFRVAVPGPLVLGRTQHLGGGLFAATG